MNTVILEDITQWREGFDSTDEAEIHLQAEGFKWLGVFLPSANRDTPSQLGFRLSKNLTKGGGNCVHIFYSQYDFGQFGYWYKILNNFVHLAGGHLGRVYEVPDTFDFKDNEQLKIECVGGKLTGLHVYNKISGRVYEFYKVVTPEQTEES